LLADTLPALKAAEARKVCPDIVLICVPTSHNKADLSLYRAAGSRVLSILGAEADICERCSIDECALDFSKRAAEELAARPWSEIVTAAAGSHVAGLAPGAADESALSAAWLARDVSSFCFEERMLIAGAALVSRARAEVLRTLGYTTSAGCDPSAKVFGNL
jgi:DNA polymerase eta